MQGSAKRQFGRTSADYATSTVHAGGMDLHLLVDAAEPAPGALALDVGTGAGHTALALAAHVRLVLALDITPEMLAEARRLGAANGVANLRLVEGAVEAVPVRPRSCDIVTCRVAAHHFRAADKAIAEMARVLRPGGRLLLVDNYAPDRPELDAFINRLEVLRDPSHVREHTLAQWQGFMAAAGLRVEIRALDCIRLDFADWVRRSQTPPDAVQRLREMLLSASPAAVRTFGITVEPQLTFSLLRFIAVGFAA